jgi:hypothetical protein
MNFDELNKFVPYHLVGKEKSIRYTPYPNITLAMPGRHAAETSPIGGDFVVMVTDPAFDRPEHQFTHTDLFKDVELKVQSGISYILMDHYYSVIHHNVEPAHGWIKMPGIKPGVFLEAVQCLAVAEHRRYKQHEKKLGGRYLPFRFAAGIGEGLWTAADAANMQKKGRPGVEILEKLHGIPNVTQKLMYDVGMIEREDLNFRKRF